MKNLRFEFRVYTENGDCIVDEWTTIPSTENIDQYGGCETVELHVSAALRAVKRAAENRALRSEAA